MTQRHPHAWRRLTIAELEAARVARVRSRRRATLNPLSAIITGLIIGLASAGVVYCFGDGGRFRFQSPRPPVEFLDALRRGAGVWILASLLLYLVQLFRGRSLFDVDGPRLLICTRCFELYTTAPTSCPCGGELEDANHWTRDPPR